MQLKGLLSAVVTPFTSNGEAVDHAVLREVVEYQIGQGVHGFVTSGSTGEFTALSTGERHAILETVLDQVAGRVPVVAHIGSMTPSASIELGQHAERSGAAAVMIVQPFFEPLDIEESLDFYRVVAGALGIPAMVYNLPYATGVKLSPGKLAKLATDVEQIEYVKESSSDMHQATVLIREYGHLFKTFVGIDTLYFTSLAEGGAGSVNGAANVIPGELVQLYEALSSGDLNGARETWEDVYPLMRFFISGGYVARVKAALQRLDRSVGDPRPPVHRLRESELPALDRAIERLRSRA